MLSSIAQFYDPLGLLSPVVVPFKRLFQEICNLKVNWDAPLSREMSDRWHELVNDISVEPWVAINRSVTTTTPRASIKSINHHVFSDASQIAYGGVVYLIIETDDSSHTELIASKSKLAPLKGETIPRLELMAALVLAQLINSIEATDCPLFATVPANWSSA